VLDIHAAFERSVEIADALTIGAATVAAVAALLAEGLADRAAVVVGALDADVIFSFSGSGYRVFDPAEVRADLEAALSAAEFAAAHARGVAMTYDDAVAFVRSALAELATATGADDA
jgi:hypothetical protein